MKAIRGKCFDVLSLFGLQIHWEVDTSLICIRDTDIFFVTTKKCQILVIHIHDIFVIYAPYLVSRKQYRLYKIPKIKPHKAFSKRYIWAINLDLFFVFDDWKITACCKK